MSKQIKVDFTNGWVQLTIRRDVGADIKLVFMPETAKALSEDLGDAARISASEHFERDALAYAEQHGLPIPVHHRRGDDGKLVS